MKRSTGFTLLALFVLIPLTLFLGSRMTGRWYYLTSTLMIIEIMIPFFLSFEQRKPQARELVIIAVLCALAIVSRFAVPIPHFKPMFAVIMIAGIALGPQTGFLIGATSALISNFFASQGPWTPWQMLAYGAAGLVAGAVFYKKHIPEKPAALALFGFICSVTVVGILLDTCTVFTTLSVLTVPGVLAAYTQGFFINVSNGLCTALTLFIFGRPLLDILDRIKVKYGLDDQT